MPKTMKLTPKESVTVRQSTPELLEVEASYGAGGKPPPRHYHPSQEEHFEVLEGAIRVRVGDEERPLSRGEMIDVRPGAVHQVWNPGREPARVLWQVRPALRTEEWFADVDRLYSEGRVGRNGMPGPLAFAPLLREYSDVFRLGVAAEPLVRAALVPLAAVGRARGYGPQR